MKNRNFRKAAAGRLVAATLAIGALALMFSTSASKAAASGATDIDITLPDIVILHYYSNVDLSVSSAGLGTYLTGTAGDSDVDEGTATPAAGGFTQNLAIGPSPLSGDPGAANLRLQNAWAVRAISQAGGTNTQLSIVNTDNTLDHTSTPATITITSVAVDDGATSGSTISFTTPGLVTPEIGDVLLTLNMNAAVNAGVYLGGTYTLTAQNI